MNVDSRSLRPKKPSCSCAVESPFCKHAVAVLFAILCHCDPGGISETLKNSLSMPALPSPSKVLRNDVGDSATAAEKQKQKKKRPAEEGDENIPETAKEASKSKPKKKATTKSKEDAASSVAPLEVISTERAAETSNPRKRKEPPSDMAVKTSAKQKPSSSSFTLSSSLSASTFSSFTSSVSLSTSSLPAAPLSLLQQFEKDLGPRKMRTSIENLPMIDLAAEDSALDMPLAERIKSKEAASAPLSSLSALSSLSSSSSRAESELGEPMVITSEPASQQSSQFRTPLPPSSSDTAVSAGKNGESEDAAVPKKKKKRKAATEEGDEAAQAEKEEEGEGGKKKKQKKPKEPKKPKTYIPAYRSAPWAILVALYGATVENENNPGYLFKQELADQASSWTDTPFSSEGGSSFYNGWSSMALLIKKGLVEKSPTRPAQFSLTEEGVKLGAMLYTNRLPSQEAHASGVLPMQISPLKTGTEQSATSSTISAKSPSTSASFSSVSATSLANSAAGPSSSSSGVPKTKIPSLCDAVNLEIGSLAAKSSSSFTSVHSSSLAFSSTRGAVISLDESEESEEAQETETPLIGSRSHNSQPKRGIIPASTPLRSSPRLRKQPSSQQGRDAGSGETPAGSQPDIHVGRTPPSRIASVNSANSQTANLPSLPWSPGVQIVSDSEIEVEYEGGMIEYGDEEAREAETDTDIVPSSYDRKREKKERKKQRASSVPSSQTATVSYPAPVSSFLPSFLLLTPLTTHSSCSFSISSSSSASFSSSSASLPTTKPPQSLSKGPLARASQVEVIDLIDSPRQKTSSDSQQITPPASVLASSSSSSLSHPFTTSIHFPSSSITSLSSSSSSSSSSIKAIDPPRKARPPSSVSNDFVAGIDTASSALLSSVPFAIPLQLPPFLTSSSSSSLSSSSSSFSNSTTPSVSLTSKSLVPASIAASSSSSASASSSSAASSSTAVSSFTARVEGPFQIILLIDYREVKKQHQKVMYKRLKEQGVHCEKRALEVGDFMWIAKSLKNIRDEIVLDFIVERKNLYDLIESINDGRYKEQKSRLKRCGLSGLIYLVEGQSEGTEKHAIVESEIARLQVDGFLVQRTDSEEETVAYLARVTKHLQDVNEARQDRSNHSQFLYSHFAASMNKTGNLTVKDLFAMQLMQFPRCTAELAAAIVSRYNTALRLCRAYSRLKTEKERHELLRDIASNADTLTGTRKTVGPALSKQIANFYYPQDNQDSGEELA